MRRSLYTPLLFSFLVAGCATPDSVKVNRFNSNKGLSTITYDANMRSIVMVNGDKNSVIKYCSEPFPDAGESTNQTLSASVSEIKDGEGVGESSGESSYSLGGRNSTVLVAREILFRLCELGQNHYASYEQQAAMFVRGLEAIEKISNSKQASGPETNALSSKEAWTTPRATAATVSPTNDRSPSNSNSTSIDNSNDSSSDSPTDTSADDSPSSTPSSDDSF